MDSTNLHNHRQLQQQQQLSGYPFFAGVSTLHDWNSTMTSEEEYYYKGHMKRSIGTFPLMNTSMFQDGHQLSNVQLDYKNNKAGCIISNDYFLKMKDMNGLSNNLFKESYFGNEQQHAFDLNENLLSEDSYMNSAKTSIAFSGLAAAADATNSSYISSNDMEHTDFQGLKLAYDGLTFKNSISGDDSNGNSFGLFSTDRMFADGLPESAHSPSSNSSNKIIESNVSNTIGVSLKAKRSNYSAEEEATPCQEASKKPRVTSQSSSTFMLKQVRKEKLGDRISALHRLVAPFGKTDTASVLTEAIGYIQFLQDQILTLSMPYTKSSQGKLHHVDLKDSSIDTKCQPVLDLESRGLCLVPTSFTSYITSSCD
ncbi:transcription factor isoform X1 [Capsicum galapagoense]